LFLIVLFISVTLEKGLWAYLIMFLWSK